MIDFNLGWINGKIENCYCYWIGSECYNLKGIKLTKEEANGISKYIREKWNNDLRSYRFKGEYVNSIMFCLKKALDSVKIGDVTIVFDPYSKSVRIEKNGDVLDFPKTSSMMLRYKKD